MTKAQRIGASLLLILAAFLPIAAAGRAHAAELPRVSCSPWNMFITCMPPIQPQPQVWVGAWCDQGSGILNIQTLNFENHNVWVAWDDQPPMGVMQGYYAFQHVPGAVDVTIGIDGAFRNERVEVPACQPMILSWRQPATTPCATDSSHVWCGVNIYRFHWWELGLYGLLPVAESA